MPYVLKHSGIHQILTSRLVNHYGLTYYGVKFWEGVDEAEAQKQQTLALAGEMDADVWEIMELEEGEMKLCNVRLRNDPAYQLFWNEARKPEVRKS
ncbi:hypothetical protein [Paenibacillus aestuarii]|uniref:Uncharacterized protein n=1 Tax=Paenibacillus aestuarii TaxID=516965 RepID=A0ABW0K6M5_9BACL|nr:hypothetical protein [Paenibacillus aestuarii]